MNKKDNEDSNPLLLSVNQYLTHLQFERRLSSNTVISYRYDLKRYIEYLFKKKNIQQVLRVSTN